MLLVLIYASVAVANLQPISRCLENIIKADFKENDLILISTEEININLPYPVIRLNAKMEIIFYLKRIDVYVVEAVLDRDLMVKFLHLSSMQMWNSRAKFVIFIHTYSEKIFNLLAEYMVYNVIIFNLEKDLTYDISTYFPFINFDANHPDIHPRIIAECRYGVLVNVTELFPVKLPSIWPKTLLAIEYLHIEPYVMYIDNQLTGLEINIVNMIADQMKVKINFKRSQGHSWGNDLSNGTYTDALASVQSNRCELVVGVFPPSAYSARDFDMTFNYMDDHLVWVVPKAKLLHAWAKLIRIFDFQSWLVIFVMLIVMCFTFYFISYKSSDHLGAWRSFEASYAILIASPIAKVPNNFRVRLVLMSWCIFCVILKADFDAGFISTLTTDSYEQQVETQADMIGAKLKLGFFRKVRENYKYSKNWKDIYIFAHAEDCMVNNDCLDRVAFRRDFATVKPQKEMDYLIDLHYITPQGNSMLYIVKDKIVRIMICMYMKKGYPIFPQFDRYLLYAKSAGFFVYWESMLTYTIKLKHNYSLRKSSLARNHVLGFAHLSSCFVFFSIGLVISLIVFCLELLHKSKCIRKKSTIT